MKQFLTYGHVLTPEEIDAHAEDGVPENPPTLDMFKEQVRLNDSMHELIYKFIASIRTSEHDCLEESNNVKFKTCYG